FIFFFFQAEDGIRDRNVTGVQTCALPISPPLYRCPQKLFARRWPSRHSAHRSNRCRPCGQDSIAATRKYFCERAPPSTARAARRSEERRVGKECRCRWWREE